LEREKGQAAGQRYAGWSGYRGLRQRVVMARALDWEPWVYKRHRERLHAASPHWPAGDLRHGTGTSSSYLKSSIQGLDQMDSKGNSSTATLLLNMNKTADQNHSGITPHTH
jgi:hypothetical protein